jgi:hypothetical protein
VEIFVAMIVGTKKPLHAIDVFQKHGGEIFNH